MSGEAPPPYSENEKKPSAPPPMHPMDGGGVSAGYTPVPHQPQHTTVIIQQSSQFGPDAQTLTCPNCQAQIITQTNYEAGLMAWLIAGGLCFFGCWLGCCLIPFCMEGCQDVEHRCPNCKTFLGKYKRI